MTDKQRFALWMTVGLPLVWVMVMWEILSDGWWAMRYEWRHRGENVTP